MKMRKLFCQAPASTFCLATMLCVALAFCGAQTAAGQAMMLSRADVAGDLVQAGPRSVVVKAGDGKNWTLQLDGNTRFKLAGTAVPEMITPKVCVRFVASIDKHTCKAQDKISKITLFTPVALVPSKTLGLEMAKAGSGEDDDDAPGGPPMGPPGMRGPRPGPGGPMAGQGPPPGQDPGALLGAKDNLLGDAPAAGAKGPKRCAAGKAADVPDVASYEVCAQVVSYHNHRLTVNVQNRFLKSSKITAELSPDVEILVDFGLAELSLAKPGDKVTAIGYSGRPYICQRTDKVVITLSNPVGAKNSRSRKPRPVAKESDAKNGEAAHRPGQKEKPAPAAVADKAPASGKAADPDPFGDDDNAPAAVPAGPAAKEAPQEKDDNSVMDDPNAKPEPAPQPKPDEVTPDSKKPDQSAEKKPPVKDDEKDVFEK